MYDKEKLYFISSRFNIPVHMLILFMKMKVESASNRRYELLYTWVQDNNITCVQFKLLLKNIRIRSLEECVLQSGKLLFEIAPKEQYENKQIQHELNMLNVLQQKYKNVVKEEN